MAGLLSKGITLSYGSNSTSVTALTNLQEIPDIGGDIDTVEVTTLADAAHTYINGLLDYGDALEFTFLYDKTQFTTLRGLTGTKYWQVGLPDGAAGAVSTRATFQGESSVRLNGVGTNEALTYTLAVTPNSDITWS